MAWLEYLLVEPIDGGSQQIESSRNFLKWKRVLGGDKKPIEDQRESFGGRIWRIVDQSSDPKQWNPQTVAPLLPISLPVPKLPPEARKDVEAAPMPLLPEVHDNLDPSGAPVSQPDPEVITKAIDAEAVAEKIKADAIELLDQWGKSPLPKDVKKPGRPKKATA